MAKPAAFRRTPASASPTDIADAAVASAAGGSLTLTLTQTNERIVQARPDPSAPLCYRACARARTRCTCAHARMQELEKRVLAKPNEQMSLLLRPLHISEWN